MSYIDSKLNTGETVVMQTELHMIIFVMPFVIIAAGVLVINMVKQFEYATKYGYIIVAVMSLLFFLSEATRYATSIYGITTQRIIARTGILKVKTIEIPLNQVETVEVDQTLLGRIIGYGTVKITGTGGSNEYLVDLNAPGKFRDAVMSQTVKK
jgi:uncharacterized membrane protein YdbT with pleckstrin-like domain